MPKENKTMKKLQSTRNDSSSAHYERQQAVEQPKPEAPSFSDYGDLLAESIGANDPLFEARLTTLASGLPVVGPMVEAYERTQQLEDLYNNSGKIPAYPALSGLGYGGVGNIAAKSLGTIFNVASGTHDLYEFYSGSPDQFRQSMNGAYL